MLLELVLSDVWTYQCLKTAEDTNVLMLKPVCKTI